MQVDITLSRVKTLFRPFRKMMEFKDQMNRTVRLVQMPQRIVSLVPSQTELLFDLGLGDRVVGITKFCVHPKEWFDGKSRVGGTKTVDFDKIRALKPDLIIGNKEENERSDIEGLEKEFPVWMSDIFDLADALEMIQQIGEITQSESAATQISEKITSEFEVLSKQLGDNNLSGKTVAYFIWNDPLFCVGSETFVNAMIETMGLTNFVSEPRYPEFEIQSEVQPDIIFLSSEPFPFKEKHVIEFQTKFPKSKVMIVDGELFSWYGSRLQKAPNYFLSLRKELASN